MPNITIQGYKFEVPEGVLAQYAVGYTIADEGEASALRQVKMENLRNNFAAKVRSALDQAKQAGQDTLPDDQINALQNDFTNYAGEYKFGARTAGEPRQRMDPLTKEMFALARDDFKKAYHAKFGEAAPTDLVKERIGELIDKRRDDYVKRAKAILRQRDTAAEGTLESIGL